MDDEPATSILGDRSGASDGGCLSRQHYRISLIAFTEDRPSVLSLHYVLIHLHS
jgi:hypothetical protein